MRKILPSLESPLLRQSRRVEHLQIRFKLFLHRSPIKLALHKVQLERYAAKVLVPPTSPSTTQTIFVLKKENPWYSPFARWWRCDLDSFNAQVRGIQGGENARQEALRLLQASSFPLVSDSKGVTRPLWVSAAASSSPADAGKSFLQFPKLPPTPEYLHKTLHIL